MAKKNNEMSGWVGWIGFASFMLLLGGTFSLIAGFVALFKEDVVYHSATNAVWIFDYSQWGWIHMLAGALALLAAGSLMSGQMYGRIVAVLIALLSAVANLAFVPVYPIWSSLIILVDIMVIFAVTVHGGDLREE